VSVTDVSTFFALLALASVVGAIAVIIAIIMGGNAAASVKQTAIPLAAMVAVTATLGSLYYSEIADFIPCRLCWYQRIFMYPMAIVLPIAAFRRDFGVRVYMMAFPVIGLGISIYHYLVQNVPSLSDSGSCDVTAPCSAAYVETFDFISIPFMAGCGFLLIGALLASTWRGSDTLAESAVESERTGS
jgi:disulfide bond formation protein DsbB